MEHNLLRILISLKILLASIARLKAVWIFLIATSSLFILSNADRYFISFVNNHLKA